jgi:hypothetical protein
MNWLDDSKLNFPAQISGILYAQFYASPVKDTRFGIFALGECPRWRHRIAADSVLRNLAVFGRLPGREPQKTQFVSCCQF